MKIIAYRERTWFSGEHEDTTDFRLWDHACRSFGVDLQLIDDWSEAIVSENSNIYLLDESGNVDLMTFSVDMDGTYVFGRTGMILPNLISSYTSVIKLTTPSRFNINE
jgi:tRNA(Leu) C34 or U34 (ribose-2'-O)-methylase TrmL